MNLKQLVNKFIAYPTYFDRGAGSISRQLKVSRGDVYEAKRLARELIKNGVTIDIPTKVPKILLLDIETSPLKAYVWSRWKQNIYLEQTVSEWFMISWSAKWAGSAEMYSRVLSPDAIKNEDDSGIIKELWQLMDEADIVIGHNSIKFDVPKINSRFIMAGLNPPSTYIQVDIKQVAAKTFGFSSNKLDALAGYFNIPLKYDTDFQLWVDCLNGDRDALKRMELYNRHDVEILEEVYFKLRPWIKNHPNMSLYYDDDNMRCTSCGSTEVKEIPDKYYYTTVGAYPVYRCKCGALSRGRKTVIPKSKNKNTLTSIGK